MIYSEMNNGSLILNIGLANKAIKSNIMWAFENIFVNLT
jgi:hypothetical protein